MKRRKSVFMGTTGISADKSASEVSAMLARAGRRAGDDAVRRTEKRSASRS